MSSSPALTPRNNNSNSNNTTTTYLDPTTDLDDQAILDDILITTPMRNDNVFDQNVPDITNAAAAAAAAATAQQSYHHHTHALPNTIPTDRLMKDYRFIQDALTNIKYSPSYYEKIEIGQNVWISDYNIKSSKEETSFSSGICVQIEPDTMYDVLFLSNGEVRKLLRRHIKIPDCTVDNLVNELQNNNPFSRIPKLKIKEKTEVKIGMFHALNTILHPNCYTDNAMYYQESESFFTPYPIPLGKLVYAKDLDTQYPEYALILNSEEIKVFTIRLNDGDITRRLVLKNDDKRIRKLSPNDGNVICAWNISVSHQRTFLSAKTRTCSSILMQSHLNYLRREWQKRNSTPIQHQQNLLQKRLNTSSVDTVSVKKWKRNEKNEEESPIHFNTAGNSCLLLSPGTSSESGEIRQQEIRQPDCGEEASRSTSPVL